MPTLEVYATDNGRILAIDRDAADHHMTIGLAGSVAGHYAVWQNSTLRPLAPVTSHQSITHSRFYLDDIALPVGVWGGPSGRSTSDERRSALHRARSLFRRHRCLPKRRPCYCFPSSCM